VRRCTRIVRRIALPLAAASLRLADIVKTVCSANLPTANKFVQYNFISWRIS
jgi:hypothetical protein